MSDLHRRDDLGASAGDMGDMESSEERMRDQVGLDPDKDDARRDDPVREGRADVPPATA